MKVRNTTIKQFIRIKIPNTQLHNCSLYTNTNASFHQENPCTYSWTNIWAHLLKNKYSVNSRLQLGHKTSLSFQYGNPVS